MIHMIQLGSREEYGQITSKWMIGRENCPFCPPNLNPEYTLWEWKFWRIVHNKYPYTGTHEHLMAVPIVHHKFASEFSIDEWAEMSKIHSFMEKFFGEKLYFSFTRENFHENIADGRSVEHWHMHFLPWRLQGKFLLKMLELQGFPVVQDLKID